MITKKKTIDERVKSVDDKFTIIIVANFFILMVLVIFMLGNQLEHFEDSTNYKTMHKNYELKTNLSQMQVEMDILKSEILLCNSLLEPVYNFDNEPIVEEIVEEKVKEVDCLVNQMEWNGTHYAPSEWYVIAPTCYEVLN